MSIFLTMMHKALRWPLQAENVLARHFVDLYGHQQVRFNNTKGGLNGWTDWRMVKDHRKRQTVIKYASERIKLNTLHRNSILPREIREAAKEDVIKLPRDSNYIRLVPRCCITSRPRGCVILWRFSRIHFRHLADNNKLAGVQRAIW